MIGNAPTWSVAERKIDGRRHVAIMNTTYRSFTDRARFPWRLLVAIPLHQPRNDGLCDPAENEALERLKREVILPTVSATCKSQFIGRTTHNGCSTLAFQIDDPSRVVEALDKLANACDYRFTAKAEYDEKWRLVSRYLSPPSARRRFRWPWTRG
jgi:hypothetical protein